MDDKRLVAAGAGDPEWRAEQRAAAHRSFTAGAMPTPRQEDWKYITVDFDVRDLPIARGGGDAPADPLADVLDFATHLEIVDGVVVRGGDEALLPLAVALRERTDAARAAAGAAPVPGDIVAAAHTAFASDGAFLHVAKGTLSPRPYLVSISAVQEGAVSFPSVWVELEEAAAASLVVHITSHGELDAMVVPQFAVHLGPSANLKLTIVQHASYSDRVIGHARVVADRDSSVQLFEVGLGAKLGRLHLVTDLEGDGSSATVQGAYFGEETQTLDYRYFMNHIGRNTSSDMFLKGAVEDHARSVFTGLIRIEETGQKTEAFQTNRNLLLSEGASAQSVPNLEILANDVRCGHGSTVGPLDEEQRYYLMSRGLDRQRADRLQVRGFFAEVLDRLPERALAPRIGEWINAKYVTAQEAGRV